MKSLLFLAALAGMANPLFAAAGPGSTALGIEVGTMTGVNAKFWTARGQALQLALGSAGRNGVTAKGAYLWHRYGAFESERDDLANNLPLYFGMGGIFHSTPAPFGTGAGMVAAKGVMGISYIFTPEPFDLFLELSPALYLMPEASFQFHAGMGARYYFGSGGK